MSLAPRDLARFAKHDGGFVGGSEALIFGVLVFVFGTLIIVNGWAVIDGKFATNAAAREAVRAVVEADAPPDGPLHGDELLARAEQAARVAFSAHGPTYVADAVSIEAVGGPLRQDRCAPVRITARLEIRALVLPGFAGPRIFTVASTHEEIVDPFRSGLSGPDQDRSMAETCGF